MTTSKTLSISFSLKNTYRVNTILYSLKQIPLVRNLLPDALYQARGLKVFANIISAIIELLSIFAGKALYFAAIAFLLCPNYGSLPPAPLFMHILLFLTVIGAFMHTSIFNPTRDKYYAMILLRMDARSYTLTNYFYSLAKVVVGFMPFAVIFGRMQDVPLALCLAIPFAAAGAKLAVSALILCDYQHRGSVYNENKLSKYVWIAAGLLLALAGIPPAFGFTLPLWLSAAAMGVFVLSGFAGLYRLLSFRLYREMNRELLSQLATQMDAVKNAAKNASEKAISADVSISSSRSGFEYLNELFIKRHKKVLWNASIKITTVCCFLLAGVLGLMYFKPDLRSGVNEVVMTWLPYFAFIMYMLNRGTGFTRVLFMNCDHSLLTYSFYKTPKFVLKLFKIRLREIIKVNALPAAVIGAGLAIVLYASGGTPNPLDYAVLFASILCMSVFFSVHYLTIYYLLQPYNAGTELKSGTYKLVMTLTYIVCYIFINVKLPILVFGVSCIAFCVIYVIAACILAYRLAPKTFRLRQ